MKKLKVRTVSTIDKNGYFIKPCLINANPLSESEEWVLPKDAVLLEPPEDIKPNYLYRYNKENNAWIPEINNTYFIEYKDKTYSIFQLTREVLSLLIDADYETYRIPDINNDLIDVNKEDLIQLKKLIARKTLTQKGL